jgi:hypothetical protein
LGQGKPWSAKSLGLVQAAISIECVAQHHRRSRSFVSRTTSARIPSLVLNDMQDESRLPRDIGTHVDLMASPMNTARKDSDARELFANTNDMEKETSSPPRIQNVAQADVVDWDGEDDPAKPMNW